MRCGLRGQTWRGVEQGRRGVCVCANPSLLLVVMMASSQTTALIVGVGTLLAIAASVLMIRRRALPKALRQWPHLGVEVRCSVIPNAGQGLFATRNFTKGDLLGVYRGRVLSLLQAHQLEDRDYLMGGFG